MLTAWGWCNGGLKTTDLGRRWPSDSVMAVAQPEVYICVGSRGHVNIEGVVSEIFVLLGVDVRHVLVDELIC